MMPEKVYLSLGSNIAPRRAYLAQALFYLQEALDVRPEAVSSMYENPAQGFVGGDFVNCAARFSLSGVEPEDLLRVCKEIERKLGRAHSPLFDKEGRRIYRDRTVDIDILLFGDRTVHTMDLQIPHPRMYQRDFVMVPLSEIIEQK